MSDTTFTLSAERIYDIAKNIALNNPRRDQLLYALVDDGKMYVSDGFRVVQFHHAPTWEEWAACYPKSSLYNDMQPNPHHPNMWPIVSMNLHTRAYTSLPWPDHRQYSDLAIVDDVTISTAIVYRALAAAAREQRQGIYIPFPNLPEILDERSCVCPGNIVQVYVRFVIEAMTNHAHIGTVTFGITDPAQTLGAARGVLVIPSKGMTTYIAPQIPFDYFEQSGDEILF